MSIRIAHRGWFRIEEEALRKIHSAFETPSEIRAAMLAYMTACRKANARQSATFQDPILSWARDMALPYREAQRALGLLESAGLLRIERRIAKGKSGNAHKLPSVYTVLTLLHEAGTPSEHVGSRGLGEHDANVISPHHSQEPFQEQPQESIHSSSGLLESGPEAARAFQTARMEAFGKKGSRQ